jgi:hypothetical protein
MEMQPIEYTMTTMNFRIPEYLKAQFDLACQVRNVQMTSQLNMFISDFVKREVFQAHLERIMEKMPKDHDAMMRWQEECAIQQMLEEGQREW